MLNFISHLLQILLSRRLELIKIDPSTLLNKITSKTPSLELFNVANKPAYEKKFWVINYQLRYSTHLPLVSWTWWCYSEHHSLHHSKRQPRRWWLNTATAWQWTLQPGMRAIASSDLFPAEDDTAATSEVWCLPIFCSHRRQLSKTGSEVRIELIKVNWRSEKNNLMDLWRKLDVMNLI